MYLTLSNSNKAFLNLSYCHVWHTFSMLVLYYWLTNNILVVFGVLIGPNSPRLIWHLELNRKSCLETVSFSSKGLRFPSCF